MNLLLIKGHKRVTERIFDGLRIIDCASFIAGPAAATVMSDFGAEVIKIEPPGMGDPYRRRAIPNPKNPLNPGFFFDSRNKKSLALDLRTEAGRAVLYRLVRDADVFITNYPPPARGRLGITYDDLKHRNERLIYASFTGYGETGPEANKPGFDATAWWARTGLMDLVRAGEEVNPARSLPGMGDHPSAMGTYGAIGTALYQREKPGQGNYVGSSVLAHGRKKLDEVGLIFGVVGRVDDIRHDEQVLAAGFLKPYADDPQLWTIDSPFFLAGQEKVPPRRAPGVGQNSDEVLREYGYSEAEIAALRTVGVVA